jgi:hypothetical protein
MPHDKLLDPAQQGEKTVSVKKAAVTESMVDKPSPKSKGHKRPTLAECALAAFLGASSLQGCQPFVRTGMKSGNCAVPTWEGFKGTGAGDSWEFMFVSVAGGPKCTEEERSKGCYAAEGPFVARVYNGKPYDLVQTKRKGDGRYPNTWDEGARLFGRARIITDPAVRERGYWTRQKRDLESIGLVVFVFTEAELNDGRRVPLCGVLTRGPEWQAPDGTREGLEGLPLLAPNLMFPVGGSRIKLFY